MGLGNGTPNPPKVWAQGSSRSVTPRHAIAVRLLGRDTAGFLYFLGERRR